jgi:hypothetical protein
MTKTMGNVPSSAQATAMAPETARMRVTATAHARVHRMAIVALEKAASLRAVAFNVAIAAV